MKKMIILASAVIALTACAPVTQQEKTELAKPVNCATAPGDLRILQSEKDSVGKQIGEGVSAVFPIGLVINVASGTEGEAFKVAIGDYNKMIDKKIAEIKTACKIK